MIGPETGDREIAELKDAGVTGIRLLEIVGGGVGMAQLERMADRCAEVGWHIQVAAKGPLYPDLVPRLAALKVPFMIDHAGWCAAPEGIDAPAFQAVLRLVRENGCYVKLSGAFRLSGEAYPFADTVPFMRALLEAGPRQVVFGSDWPHVGLYEPGAGPMSGRSST